MLQLICAKLTLVYLGFDIVAKRHPGRGRWYIRSKMSFFTTSVKLITMGYHDKFN